MRKRYILLVIFFIILNFNVIAISYQYEQKIPIITQGKQIGYVKPYYQSSILGSYAYVEWQRNGFPVGNSYPIFLVEGTTIALPFGLNGEFLKVTIGKISGSNVDLIIDQKNILQESDKISQDVNKNIEKGLNDFDKTSKEMSKEIKKQSKEIDKQIEEIDKQTKHIIDEANVQLQKLNSQLESRLQKTVNRGYHSSLHIIDENNKLLQDASIKIKTKEAELAEKIEDKVVAIVLDSTTYGTGITYNILVNQLTSSFRHDITTYIYNVF